MLDDELRALVSVEPAAGFDAQVRTRVRADSERRAAWLTWWRPLGAVMAAAAIVALAIAGSAGRDNGSGSSRPAAPLGNRAALTYLPLAAGVGAQPPMAATDPAPGADVRPAGGRLSPVDRLPAAILNPAEVRALQQLFASPPLVAAASGLERTAEGPDLEPLVIPELSFTPLAIEAAEGEPDGH